VEPQLDHLSLRELRLYLHGSLHAVELLQGLLEVEVLELADVPARARGTRECRPGDRDG
jgi:hypothetical protein